MFTEVTERRAPQALPILLVVLMACLIAASLCLWPTSPLSVLLHGTYDQVRAADLPSYPPLPEQTAILRGHR
jgi:hypothetical protein